MEIETFEVEKANSEAAEMAQDSEALELIEKLGLTGQKKILNKDTATRNPYRVMEKQEYRVYSALLTAHSKLENYDADAIPLRVLQVAAHAKECGFFHELQVWAPDPAIFKDDPILVGVVQRDTGYGWKEDVFHLLARWGKTLLPLEQMEAEAMDKLRAKSLGKLKAIAAEVQSRITEIEHSMDIEQLASSPCFSK